ncbi:MAG: ABC transporter ATP-binding protein, partial [Micromonosporaceae bacterium]
MTVDVDQWRGVASEEGAERTAAEAPDEKATIRLRAASRALLASLLRPHKRLLAVMIVLLLVQNAAGMAG